MQSFGSSGRGRGVPAMVALLMLALVAGCGGGDDTADESNGGATGNSNPATAEGEGTQAEPTGGSGGGGVGVGLGTATIDIPGAEDFSFDVSCLLAMQTVQGAGERTDGVPAFLRAIVPREGSSSSAVQILIRVGASQLSDTAAYEWTGEGEPGERSDTRISGSLGLKYGGGTESRFTEGDVKDATFEIDCS